MPYTLLISNDSGAPWSGLDVVDLYPAGLSYVDESAVFTRSGTDGLFDTPDDTETRVTPTGVRPMVFTGIDVAVGTLGKSLGSFGAFVTGSRALRDLLVNVARSFIFSCALAPPQVAAARAALHLVRAEPWRRREASARSST